MTSSGNENGAKHTVVGKITSVYGVKGWVKVFSYTQPKENISQYKQWNLSESASKLQRSRTLKVSQCKAHGNGLVAKIEGIDDRDLAKTLCGQFITIDTQSLPPLAEDDFYWHQLEGLTVEHVNGDLVGRVAHLMETGSNDVLVVKPCKGSLDKRERLIPYLYGDVVQAVDLENNVLVIDWDLEF